MTLKDRNGVVLERYAFSLEKTSSAFRHIDLEMDLIHGTQPPQEHLLGDLRVTVTESFARAGIALLDGGSRETIASEEGGQSWTEAELDATMRRHFSQFHAEEAAWRIYLLVATRFPSPSTTGIMFDTFGRHRQGCAVFYDSRREFSTERDFQRDYIRTTVHEIGHALNLLHSFDPLKRFGRRTAALSFMNYPHRFNEGTSAYWSRFGFTFEPEEVVFMRHGELNAVVPGGANFGTGGHDEAGDAFFPSQARSGLKLTLRVRPHREPCLFEFGEPVHVEAKLSNLSGEERVAEDTLHPAHGQTLYRIRKPNGRLVVHSPLVVRCDEPRAVQMHPERSPAIYEDVDLTYGSAGFNFVEPGCYRIQAVCHNRKGPITSNVLQVWIRYPNKDEENGIVPVFDDRVGQYLTFWGSKSPLLSTAEDVLDSLAENPSLTAHPLLDWRNVCRASLAVNGFREVDVVTGEVKVLVSPSADEKMLRESIGIGSKRQPRLSNLVFGHFAGLLLQTLDKGRTSERAEKAVHQVSNYFREQNVPSWVLDQFFSRWRAT